MGKYNISPQPHNSQIEANVFLGNAKAYYDRTAKKSEMITLLPGSILSKQMITGGWIPENMSYLIREGFIEDKGSGYEIIKPISGSPSGTAAFTLGKEGPLNPSGYKLWVFSNGETIEEAGERPDKAVSI